MDREEKDFSVDQPVPPACGDNPTPTEASNSKKMEEKRKERIKQEKAADGARFVVSGAKIQCTMCTNPIGTLIVTDLNPTIQNKPMATKNDKQKINLMFTGTCSKSPNAAVPCVALIQPTDWKDTGTFKVNGNEPLLFKSTIKCVYGGTDITFKNCGQ